MNTKKEDIFFIPYDSESETYKMNEEFIFSYSFSDGFTFRLLSIHLLVDLNFNCFIEIESSEEISLSNGQRFRMNLNIPLPDYIEKNLKRITNHLRIKESIFHNYTHQGTADTQSLRFIYGDLSSKTLTYLYPEKDEYYYDLNTKTERIRMELEQDTIRWTNLIYKQAKILYSEK